MREILFRGKQAWNDEWAESEYPFGTIHCGAVVHDFITETIGQYTGLTDKNGKKIFEGDICKHRSDFSGEYIISVVTYTDGQFLAIADENSGFNLSDKLEVIGNIHDNPELLKGE